MLWDGNLLELIKEQGRGSPSYSLGWCEIGFFLNQRRNMRMSTTPIYLKEGSPPHSIKIVLDETFPESRKKCRNNHHPNLIKGATIANPPRTMLWDGTFLQPKNGGGDQTTYFKGRRPPYYSVDDVGWNSSQTNEEGEDHLSNPWDGVVWDTP